MSEIKRNHFRHFLNFIGRPLGNQQGVAILITLLVMSLLLIIGMTMIGVSNTETSVARNEQIALRNFYNTETVVVEAVEAIASETPVNLTSYSPLWLVKKEGADEWDHTDLTLWDYDDNGGNDNAEESALVPNSAYAAIDNLQVPGNEMNMTTESEMRQYGVFALYEGDRGKRLLELGYRLRFYKEN